MILVLSGTKDGRELINILLTQGFKVLAYTATQYGKTLVNKHENLKVVANKLNSDDMKDIITEYNISHVVDATHPYAENVSKNAILACKQLNIEYIRFERKSTDIDIEEKLMFNNFEEAALWLKDKTGNIMLTIGSNNLKVFTSLIKTDKLFVRVLPTQKVIQMCEDIGLRPKNIIAMQGPFSKELNKALFNQYDIKYMVTKDSGNIGGTKEKLEAAKECNITTLVIKRPQIDYGIKYYDFDSIIHRLK